MNENTKLALGKDHPVTALAHAGGCPPVVRERDAQTTDNQQETTDSTTLVTEKNSQVDEASSHTSQASNPTENIAAISPSDKQEKSEMEEVHWFVMRSSYCREQKAKAALELDGFECYVPLQSVREEKKGIVKTRIVAIVHNLVFVRTSRKELDPWKKLHEADAALRYTIDKSTHKPMIVDDKSMNDFIMVTTQSDDALLYLDNPDVVLTKGQPVEIIIGPFKGVRGHVIRIRRDRRVAVSLNGVISVALASMPRSYFKLLEE